MTKEKDQNGPAMPHTNEDEADVILLTRKADQPMHELEGPPVEYLSNHDPSHTLDGIPPESLETRPGRSPKSNDPVLLLGRSEGVIGKTGADPVPPLPSEYDAEEDGILAPDLLSKTIGEEDLLFEMSKELHVKLDDPVLPAQGSSLSVVETHTGPMPQTPSLDDLPWATPEDTSKAPLTTPPRSQPSAMHTTATDISVDSALLEDLANSMNDPMEQSSGLLGGLPQGSLATMPVFSLAPPLSAAEKTQPLLATNSAASTHVDVDLSDDLFVQGLLEQLVQHCTRVCLFVYQAPLLLGFDTRLRNPETGDHATPDVAIKDVLFPTHLASTFAKVIQTQQPFRGPLPEVAIDRVLFASLGGPLPQYLAIYPIVQNDTVVALFTLDGPTGLGFLDETGPVPGLIKRAHELDYRWHPPDLLSYFEQL